MAAPHVSGAVALLLERDPTLTQEKAVVLLQAGAQRFRAPVAFYDQGGPGELDVRGALEAQDRMRDPRLALPSRARSWIVPSRSYAPADGALPVTTIVELRAEDGITPADLFERSRLAAVARVGGRDLEPAPTLVRRGPGLYTFDVAVPPGLGGYRLELGATFDGEPVVSSVELPIGTDPWLAVYPARAKGGCGVGGALPPADGRAPVLALAAVLATVTRRRSSRRPWVGRHSGASVSK